MIYIIPSDHHFAFISIRAPCLIFCSQGPTTKAKGPAPATARGHPSAATKGLSAPAGKGTSAAKVRGAPIAEAKGHAATAVKGPPPAKPSAFKRPPTELPATVPQVCMCHDEYGVVLCVG